LESFYFPCFAKFEFSAFPPAIEDKALDHPEPEFIEVPIQQLLPEKWHSDYVRACGGGERGEQKLAKFQDGVYVRKFKPLVKHQHGQAVHVE